MSRKVKGKKQGPLIDDIALGFTTVLGITGAAAGVFIPGAAIPVAAIQAGAYCPAVVAAIVKRSAHDRRFSEKINEQINSCAELTAKEYLEELKVDRPAMYALFRDVWEKEGIYDQSSTLGSIEENMKGFLITETRWEGYEITPKDINDVVDTYVQRFFIKAKDYPELNQSILFGVSQKTGELEARQDVLEDKMDGLASSGKKDIRAFYEHIYEEFTKTPKSNLYGKISLKDGYIEPMIDVEGRTQSVREYLESWVESDSTITVIGGEPGHGKTSLCWKAMYDFYKVDWLKDKVDNVFCFSLNPAKTDALANDSFNLYKLLSWGNNRTNREHVLYESDCKNALIFFDGFDELLEWWPGLSLMWFIENEIEPFQEETGSHVIITTRNMAIDMNTDCNYEPDKVRLSFSKLQLIKKDQQIMWIESYIKRCRDISSQKSIELEEYLKSFRKIPKGNDLEQILGIPIIFRMLVEAQYIPEEYQSIPGIYDELFHITWKRHHHLEIGTDGEQGTKKRLQDLAIKIFSDENETAEVLERKISSWLFSFYMTNEGKKRVGFLHRSFYQYFLANEVLSWYCDYADGKDEGRLKYHLSYLARRKLDRTTLEFIRELFTREYDSCDDKETIRSAFDTAYAILKETDGYMPMPSDTKVFFKKETQIRRASNVFWNIISIGSICGQIVTSENINTEALRTYGLSGGILLNAIMVGTHLNDEVLKAEDSIWLNKKTMLDSKNRISEHPRPSELIRFGLSGTNSINTVVSDSTISGTPLSGVYLRGTDFKGADLREAYLMFADFGRTDLREANFQKANLGWAYLSGAYLSRGNFSKANFENAYLRGANLNRTNLNEADLRGVNLKNGDLRGAYLNEAKLRGANLNEANLENAKLVRADFSNADLSNADLSNADLSNADLSNAILNGANLNGADISGADLSGAELEKADLSGANLNRVNLKNGDLRGANLSGAYLNEAKLRGANLNEANLKNAMLFKADFSNADLRRANLEKTDLSGADLSGADFREAVFKRADFKWANFRSTDLRRAELRDIDLRGVSLDMAIIKGLKLNYVMINSYTAYLLEKQGCDISNAYMRGNDYDELGWWGWW